MVKKLSFVIPCYRSEGLVSNVINEIKQVVGERCDLEIIAVNDCSPDHVLEELISLARVDQRIKVIDFAKNMGKHAALMAGYGKATGDIIVGVDDDGQCPVDQLWKLLEPLEEGYDIVITKYPSKKQSSFKNFGSLLNDWMTRLMLDKPKNLQLSNFYAMKRFICDEILRYKNPYPYVDGLFLRTTNKIKNVEIEERERISGTSGYTLRKSLSLWMNGFTAFSVKPLRLATLLGFVVAALGLLFSAYVIIRKLMMPEIAAGYSSVMAIILFIGGVIMFLLGLLGEYIGRIYICLNQSPQYVIRAEYDFEALRQKEANTNSNGVCL